MPVDLSELLHRYESFNCSIISALPQRRVSIMITKNHKALNKIFSYARLFAIKYSCILLCDLWGLKEAKPQNNASRLCSETKVSMMVKFKINHIRLGNVSSKLWWQHVQNEAEIETKYWIVKPVWKTRDDTKTRRCVQALFHNESEMKRDESIGNDSETSCEKQHQLILLPTFLFFDRLEESDKPLHNGRWPNWASFQRATHFIDGR